MTPYMLLMPTVKAAPPQPSTSSSKASATASNSTPSARETRHAEKNKSSSSAADTSSVITKDDDLTKDKDTTASTDPTLFEQLMASLLTMAAPAQTQTTTTPPVANDTTGTVVAAAATTDASATPAPVQFGAAFNMQPASLVVPQTTSGEALIDPATGDFTDALLTALTPGVGTPPPETATAPVAAPTVAATDDTTLSLTVTKFVSSDSRLVATGLDPAQMEVLKNNIEAAAAAAKTDGATAAAPLPDDAGIITVTITPEKPAAPPVQAPSVANVTVLAQTPAATETSVVVAAAATAVANDTADTTETPVVVDQPVEASVDTSADFDPVEFRIAQKFLRPLASPAPLPTNATPATPTPVQTANSNVSVHVDTSIKGKVDSSASLGVAAATPDLSTIVDANAGTSLTVTPAGIPLSVSTSVLTSPVVQNVSAASSHPAIQTVANVIAKNAKEGGAQTISLRLDPPDLGKLQIKMKYEKGDPLKVHVVLEKADTAAMFQRDSHALQSALNDAGIQTDGSSLSFELSQDGSAFQNAMGQDSSPGRQGGPAATEIAASEAPSLETSMDIFTDSKTGLTHYNLRV